MLPNLFEKKLIEIETRISQLINECISLKEECKKSQDISCTMPDLRNLHGELYWHDQHQCVTRTCNALSILNIHTEQDLIDSGFTIKELSKQRNMGKTTALRFAELLKEHIGYEMK